MDKTASATITNICAISIAAILGVLTRTSVNLLFGPTRTGILSVNDILFADLASNFLGCFVLGCHVVVKERVTIPEALALAISTGYAGSVTSTLAALAAVRRASDDCVLRLAVLTYQVVYM